MNYLLAKTFTEGSVAIPLSAVPNFLAYSEELQGKYKRKIEVLVVSAQEGTDLDEAWPEHAPVQMVADLAALDEALAGKLTKKESKEERKKGGKKR